MSKETGFYLVDHGPFQIMEFKLNDVRISAEQLVFIAEQMRLQLLEFGCQIEVTKKIKASPA